MDYPWYTVVNDAELQQGDVLRNFPYLYPDLKPAHLLEIQRDLQPSVEIIIAVQDVIVMTQSCDLANDKVDSIILCPVYSLEDMESELGSNAKEIRKKKEDIRRGVIPSLHMLNKSEVPEVGLQVVGFKQLLTASKDVATEFARDAGDRIRLLPPYREHLSQAFARYFMRVGLPSDIQQFV